MQVHFKVTNTWKGNVASAQTIATGFGDADCGYEFKEGKEYIVYASKSSMYGVDKLSTTICRRTNELSSANEDLSVLGEGKPTEPKATPIDLEQKSYIWYVVIPLLLTLGATWFIKRKKGNE
ncbi:hypothetical protein [Ammoniphilus sp. YIM 78166]|uniref:hypothetical protein n=1 Tax=Ammoniphilus sp. YIM 78166 TaxID=1644106 RepID=UPI00106FE163|nr:hypothetical protein [Ammoniphilus sp. YIM 78166]